MIILLSQSRKMYITAEQKRDDIFLLKRKRKSTCPTHSEINGIAYNAGISERL